MLRIRTKRRAAAAERAVAQLAQIRASIAALGDEDLLDLADIFAQATDTPLRDIASAEMLRRNLSL